MIEATLGPGISQDVTVYNGSIYLCYGHPDGRLLFETFDETLQRTQPTQVIRPSGCASAYPRMSGHWLMYRNENDVAVLHDLRYGTWRPFDLSGGTHPVAIDATYYGWRTDSRWLTVVRRLDNGAETVYQSAELYSEGLSRFLADGTPVYRAADRLSVPGGTYPVYAADLVVLEHPASGVLARLTDGREMHLWAGQVTNEPRCDALDAERFVVTSWGGPLDGPGVRLGIVSRSEFRPTGIVEAPRPGPVPLPTGGPLAGGTSMVKVDITQYSDTQIVVHEPSTDMEITIDMIPTGVPHERDVHVAIETPRGRDRSGRIRKVRFD